MNKDTVKGNWKELSGKLKAKWAKLTDNEVEGLNGNLKELSGTLQKSYGYAKEKAEREAKKFRASLSK